MVIYPINQSNSIQMPVFFKEGSDAQTVKINLNQFPYINENIDILINLLANCQGCELNISVIPTKGESMKTFILTYPSNLKSEAVAEIKEVLTMLNSNKDIKNMISMISFSVETNPHIPTTVGRSIPLRVWSSPDFFEKEDVITEFLAKHPDCYLRIWLTPSSNNHEIPENILHSKIIYKGNTVAPEEGINKLIEDLSRGEFHRY
jgi:hypothetical protein